MGKQVRLIASLYEQPRKWDQGRDDPTIRRTQGEVFETLNDDEFDRLTTPDGVGYAAAEDPVAVQKRAEEELKRRQAQLEAEKQALEDQIGATAKQAPEKLSGKALDAELSKRGLPTDGTVDEKRDRLAQAVTQENPPAP